MDCYPFQWHSHIKAINFQLKIQCSWTLSGDFVAALQRWWYCSGYSCVHWWCAFAVNVWATLLSWNSDGKLTISFVQFYHIGYHPSPHPFLPKWVLHTSFVLILANASQKGCQTVICYLSTSQEGKQREKLVLYQSSSWKLYDRRKPGKRNAGVSVIQSEAMTEGRKEKHRCCTSHSVWSYDRRKEKEKPVLY